METDERIFVSSLAQDRGLIRPVATHGRQVIYTRATNAA